ncbi:hypothetical protein L1987_01647 [Smallanthus sonchifolius]|uniref:Uncharacterized protein n=1 Tax=Smallanthus sonchifolius TaxID=185202 RepID=A0ACB9K5V9_9ASTR|nr:hypothetical protein L1987_01647 [Smallanthus sonchifolius]
MEPMLHYELMKIRGLLPSSCNKLVDRDVVWLDGSLVELEVGFNQDRLASVDWRSVLFVEKLKLEILNIWD